MHVTDRHVFRPVQTAVAILKAAAQIAPGAFAWRLPPYEYEYEKAPIDILWGNSELRLGIDEGASVQHILRDVPRDLQRFEEDVRPHLIYG